jgi:sugar phosphate isomerase/epimerase
VPPGAGRIGAEPGLTLLLAGDVMLGRGVARDLEGNWEAAFAEVRPWLAGGGAPAAPIAPPERVRVLALANLESPLTTAPQQKDGYDLRAPPEAVAALSAAGFDAVSLANNHALDAGEAGLRETVGTLREAGIVPWIERATVRAADGPDAQIQSGVPAWAGLALDDSTAPLDIQAAAAAVSAAAKRSSVVIVSVHWGGEYQATPSARQRAIATALAEAGADVIAGHGPHVLQQVEWVGEAVVAYSLGNFLFDQPYPSDCRWGAILRVRVQGARAISVDAVPTIAEHGRVRPADPETTADILSRLGLEPDGTASAPGFCHYPGETLPVQAALPWHLAPPAIYPPSRSRGSASDIAAQERTHHEGHQTRVSSRRQAVLFPGGAGPKLERLQ